MNALFGIAVVTGLIYGIFIDGTYFKIYLAVLAFYTIVFNYLLINKKQTTKRKNIMITTWNCKLMISSSILAPGDPTAYLVIDYDVTKALPFIKKLK